MIIQPLVKCAAAFLAAALLFGACSRESEKPVQENTSLNDSEWVERTFTVAPVETKTRIAGAKVSWSQGDVVGIIDNKSPGFCHPFVATSAGSTASFQGSVSIGATEYMAIYPYDATAQGNFETGIIKSSISPEQSLAPESGNSLLMASKVDGDVIHFHHAAGIVSFTLKSSDHVSRVLFRGNDGEVVAGSASIAVTESAAVSVVSGGYTVSGVPAEGDTFADGTYYLSVAPGMLSSGFTLHLFREMDHKEAHGYVGEGKVISCGAGFNVGTVSPAAEKWMTSIMKDQTDVYVSPDGAGDATGTDATNAMPWIDFSRIMNYGDGATGTNSYSLYQYKSELIKDRTFHLAAGTYFPTETLDIFFDGVSEEIGFTIQGVSKESTIIDGSNCPGLRAMNICSVVEPLIQGVTFSNFTATNGGALYLDGSFAKIRDCSFSANATGGNGGAIYCNGGSLFLGSSSFKENTAGSFGNDVFSSGTNNGFAGIHNCTFIASADADGSDVFGSSAMALTHNTFFSGSSALSHLCVNSAVTAENGILLAGNIVNDVNGGGIGHYNWSKITSGGYNIYSQGSFTSTSGTDQTDVPTLIVSGDNTYYSWSGETSFIKPLLDDLEAVIARVSTGASVKPANVLESYSTWLREEAGWDKDIRGVNRATYLWPGSYQEGSGTSTLNGTLLDPANNLYGMIVNSATEKGIAGVPVTDGFQFVVTDANGVYQFKSAKGARRVYYTLPSGYEVTLDGEYRLPKFYNDCEISEMTSYRKDFVLTPVNWDQSRFTMLWMGDPQVRYAYDVSRFKKETMADVIATIDAKQALGEYMHIYAQSLGDLTYDSNSMWEEYRTAISNLKLSAGGYLPFFQMMGNHDHNGLSEEDPDGLYIQYFGPKDYSYNIGDVHIVIMDNVKETAITTSGNPNGYTWNYDEGGLTEEQVEWLRQDIALVDNKSEKMVIFAAHVPSYGMHTKQHEVLSLLTSFKEAHFIAGHVHQTYNLEHPDYVCAGGKPIYSHAMGAACGCWWSSTMNKDGTPNGFGFYEIEGASMKNWIYKGTDRDFDYQMRVYDGNATYDAKYNYHWYEVNKTPRGITVMGDERFRNSFVVNLWNDDREHWTVEMYQGGEKIGDFQRVAPGEATDVCVSVYNVSRIDPNKSSSWHGSRSSHFWYFKPASGNPSSETDWEVVATQIIPGSGEVNVYRANTLQTDFTGFAAP